MAMEKMWHRLNHRLQYEGEVWHLDVSLWRDADTGAAELRVHSVTGDTLSPNMPTAIQQWADAEGLTLIMDAAP